MIRTPLLPELVGLLVVGMLAGYPTAGAFTLVDGCARKTHAPLCM